MGRGSLVSVPMAAPDGGHVQCCGGEAGLEEVPEHPYVLVIIARVMTRQSAGLDLPELARVLVIGR